MPIVLARVFNITASSFIALPPDKASAIVLVVHKPSKGLKSSPVSILIVYPGVFSGENHCSPGISLNLLTS